jgi:hypothetical protein
MKIYMLAFVLLWLVPGTEAKAISDRLLDAIEQVESKGVANAIGDNGNAVGSFQLWKIYVDEVNRIVGHRRFNYADRYNRAKSRQMARIFLRFWSDWHNINDDFDICRLHNGGSRGHKKEATIFYAKKVMAAMKGR